MFWHDCSNFDDTSLESTLWESYLVVAYNSIPTLVRESDQGVDLYTTNRVSGEYSYDRVFTEKGIRIQEQTVQNDEFNIPFYPALESKCKPRNEADSFIEFKDADMTR